MQDFTKQNMTKLDVSKKTETLKKQPNWLTKNRFWNLAFLFLIPSEISLLQSLPSWVATVVVALTAFGIIGFAPKDPNSISREEAAKDIHVRIAAFAIPLGVWISSDFISSITSIIGVSTEILSFAPYVLFSLFIPILLLCYKNIPISYFIDTHQTNQSEEPPYRRPRGFRSFVGDTDIPLSIRSQNFKK